MKLFLSFFCLMSVPMLSQSTFIKNTTFEKQLSYWNYGISGAKNVKIPEASFVVVKSGMDDESALRVRINKSFPSQGADKIYLKQGKIELKKGKTYRVSFYVKSKVKRDEIYVAIGSAYDNDKLMELNKSFLGNDQWQKLTYTFSDKSVNFKNITDYKKIAIYFGFNSRNGEYMLDDINVEQIKK